MFDVIVIGGGPAGVTAALRASELGASVALVERGRMGGTCTNDGCVPTRVLAKAARLIRDAEQFGDYGLMSQCPELDFTRLMACVQERVYRLQEKKQLEAHLDDSGVIVCKNVGEAHFVDTHGIELGDGTRLESATFILCPGGHARRLRFPGSEYALTHSDIWSVKKLPRSAVVVGAAATGCQLASILAALGSRVWLLDIQSRILPGEDEAVSTEIARVFGKRGIVVLPGIDRVERIERQERDLRLVYTHQGEECFLNMEAVILATGWTGNIDGLNLPAAGVKTERGYIVVDDCFATSAPHIFAAGDITGRMMLVQSAGNEARIAAECAVLGRERSAWHQIVPHGGFTDPEYGSVGLTEAQASGDAVIAVVPYDALDRAVIDGHLEGFAKLIVSRASHRILGAHVVGEQAVEIVQAVAAGMAAGMHVEQLSELELAYPTFTAIVGLAARQVMHKLGAIPLQPGWSMLRHRPAAEWEMTVGQGF